MLRRVTLAAGVYKAVMQGDMARGLGPEDMECGVCPLCADVCMPYGGRVHVETMCIRGCEIAPDESIRHSQAKPVPARGCCEDLWDMYADAVGKLEALESLGGGGEG